MRYVRFSRDAAAPQWGRLTDDDVIESPYGSHRLADVAILPPGEPTKIVCVGLNYANVAVGTDLNQEAPTQPFLFMKPTTALIGHGGTIRYPDVCDRLIYEGELVVVIGRKAVAVDEADADNYIAGYTIGNDVTGPGPGGLAAHLTRAKSYDTFAPVGPYLVRGESVQDATIETRVNGEVKQSDTVSNMIFGINHVIAHITSIMTLMPGDMVMTGTPAGIGDLAKGDRVEVSITGLGTLTNDVA
jgi:2-keto-4-pentenoate hydratase/2-oxohepta-3-ene-1,7-dioic acid hydratase in catechol pathway